MITLWHQHNGITGKRVVKPHRLGWIDGEELSSFPPPSAFQMLQISSCECTLASGFELDALNIVDTQSYGNTWGVRDDEDAALCRFIH